MPARKVNCECTESRGDRDCACSELVEENRWGPSICSECSNGRHK